MIALSAASIDAPLSYGVPSSPITESGSGDGVASTSEEGDVVGDGTPDGAGLCVDVPDSAVGVTVTVAVGVVVVSASEVASGVAVASASGVGVAVASASGVGVGVAVGTGSGTSPE